MELDTRIVIATGVNRVDFCADFCAVVEMAVLVPCRHLGITAAASRGISSLVAEAEDSGIVLEPHGKPVAAVIATGHLAAFEEAAADLRGLALVLARVATDSGERVSLDDVLSAFGVTRGQLDSVSDED